MLVFSPHSAMPSKPRQRRTAVRNSGFSTPSLDRALAVLECLSRYPEGASLSQIAAEIGLSLNFVYRVAQSLVAHGYALRDADKRFRVGPKLLGLCQPVHDDVPLAEAALPAMRWLSEQTDEAAHLGMITGAEGIVLERVTGTALIKYYAERGTRFPLHTSAPGKAILAFLPETRADAVIARMKFERYQPWTITSPKEFRRHLEVVREQGFATDLGEYLEGHNCLGAPILDPDGHATASLWITGPSQRLSEERIVKLAPTVVRAGRMVSAALAPSRTGGRA